MKAVSPRGAGAGAGAGAGLTPLGTDVLEQARGTSLVVQWLRLCASTAGGAG